MYWSFYWIYMNMLYGHCSIPVYPELGIIWHRRLINDTCCARSIKRCGILVQ